MKIRKSFYRGLAGLLTGLMITLPLASCNGQDSSSSGSNNSTQSTQSTAGEGSEPVTEIGVALGNPQSSQPGLYVQDGVVMLAGKPFYGIGTNYYDIAWRFLTSPLDGDFENGIQKVASYKLPFVRLRFSSYSGEGMSYMESDPELFFQGMDRCVELCEKYKIGIIASLVWTPLGYLEEGQTYGDFFRNPEGEGYQKMLEYMEAVVTRYKNSPAIWGWEVGNEFNLSCDIPGSEYDLSADDLAAFYADVAPKIREWDGTNRIIETGNSQNRHASRSLMDNGTWNDDSLEDMRYMTELYDNDAMSVTSIHIYNTTQRADGRDISVEEYLKIYVDFCKDMGKPLFIGEYCDDEINGVTEWTEEIEKESLEKFQVVHDAILANDIQLATIWIFDRTKDAIANPGTYQDYMLTQGKEANEQFIAEGKQDLDSYWNSMTNVIYTAE